MTVIVEFNPDIYDELFADVLVDYPGLLENLRQDFLEYAESDGERLPNCFGKVSAYMQPYAAMQAGLMHIHIAMPPDTFPENCRNMIESVHLTRKGMLPWSIRRANWTTNTTP